jgi:hypothetical protein
MKTSRSFFLSAFKSDLDAKTNLDRHFKLRARLNELGYITNRAEGIGSYNNIPELMFVVSGDNNTESDIALLCKEFGQECFMIVYGEDSKAELVYTNGRNVIGTMVDKGNEFNTKGKDYSFIGDRYYVVE